MLSKIAFFMSLMKLTEFGSFIEERRDFSEEKKSKEQEYAGKLVKFLAGELHNQITPHIFLIFFLQQL